MIVVAVGTSPNHPADVPFDGEAVFDSESILAMPRIPGSMTVLGAGVIGIEYASIFAALGLRVTLVDTREQLLPYLDREVVDILANGLAALGVTVVHDDRYACIEKLPGTPGQVRCRTRRGMTLDTDVLLYCVGRDGNTGTSVSTRSACPPRQYGLIGVNEHYQTAVPHIYAVGDVIGFPALASTSMEQGRRAVRHAFDLPAPAQGSDHLPFAIYAIPEVSYVGETEEQLRERGVRYVVGRGRYALNPRGQILGATEGLLKLLCDADTGAAPRRAHRRSQRQRAGPRRCCLSGGLRHLSPASRLDLQLPDTCRPLPARGAGGGERAEEARRRGLTRLQRHFRAPQGDSSSVFTRRRRTAWRQSRRFWGRSATSIWGPRS